MQVTETLSQGLKREYRVVLPAQDLAARLEGQLVEMKDKVRINGFRPGKVPMAHLKKLYGRSVMGEVVQNAVNEANRKIVDDHGLRLALEPRIDLASDQGEVERALAAEGDLSFTVAVETLPKIEVGSFDDIALERIVAEVSEADVAQTIERMANQNRTFTERAEPDAVAQTGDKVTIDFKGSIRGEPFEGGSGEGVDVVIGSDSFIPGFEAQLVGAKVGEERTIDARFPDEYAAPALAGQEASFATVVKAIAAPGAVDLDDAFAKGFGFDDVGKLKEAITERMRDEFAKASRDKLKRRLLDALDARYAFELPDGLVSQEFDNVWRQVEAERTASGRGFEDEGTTEDKARADYRRIAERRVRLGLLLAEVGDGAGVKITDDEVTKALVERVRQYPGQEKEVWDYYRKNPQALGEIRAPIFEEKVVDHIIGAVKVSDRVVPKAELFKLDEEDASAAA